MITLKNGKTFRNQDEWEGYKTGVKEVVNVIDDYLRTFVLGTVESFKAREDGLIQTSSGFIFETPEAHQAYIDAVNKCILEIEMVSKMRLIPSSESVEKIETYKSPRKTIVFTNGKEDVELFIAQDIDKNYRLNAVENLDGHRIVKRWEKANIRDDMMAFSSYDAVIKYIASKGYFRKNAGKKN